jgi:molecular chaperone GrpE
MGLEAIPTQNQFFDDRRHEARGVAHRPDLPDGWVVEEILPGYRLGGRMVRPARVVVNRHDRREEPHD